jgi:hypothetical protein
MGFPVGCRTGRRGTVTSKVANESRLWSAEVRVHDDACVLRSIPDPSVVPVSLRVSVVVEGPIFVRGNRGMLPSSTGKRFLFHPALPATRTR